LMQCTPIAQLIFSSSILSVAMSVHTGTAVHGRWMQGRPRSLCIPSPLHRRRSIAPVTQEINPMAGAGHERPCRAASDRNKIRHLKLPDPPRPRRSRILRSHGPGRMGGAISVVHKRAQAYCIHAGLQVNRPCSHCNPIAIWPAPRMLRSRAPGAPPHCKGPDSALRMRDRARGASGLHADRWHSRRSRREGKAVLLSARMHTRSIQF
jgi:hypothetical protein